MNARQKHLRLELKVTWFFSWVLFLSTIGLFVAAALVWDWRYAAAGFVVLLGHEAAQEHETKILDQVDC